MGICRLKRQADQADSLFWPLLKNVLGNAVEIIMIRGDQLAQAHLTEIVLKVKIKFEMPLKRQSILALICHKFIDTCRIFQVSQTRADSLSVLFLPSPNPLF